MSRRVLGGVAIVASAVLLTSSAAVAAPVDSAPVGSSTGTSGAGRVLQSVAVDMAPDGTLTTIDGTVVRDHAGKATTTDEAYSPGKVSEQLPVRVLTAYRTKDKSGTDLADLDGYTGRVRIDLTVQNLTVHPENLTYDVDGFSRTQPALVGAPLTLIASAALKGTKADAVVTGDHQSRSATNGVLSQDRHGTTQVQWATILAPPQLDSSATLSLVVNAKDFEVPDFALSVEPGLVTDPSVGNLIDAAFNPARSNELQLETRTIALIAEVNSVLDRASGTIARVRRTLSGAARTLGTQTVSDLRASTAGIASAVKGLSNSVDALGSDLSSSLKATKSTTVAELSQIVGAVDSMLGDTSMKAPEAKVDGNGCATTVNPPRQADSVYGNLLEVVSQLKGYAKASDACKGVIQGRVASLLGPTDPPTDGSCTPADSLTCQLATAEKSFADAANTLLTEAQQAFTDLQDSLNLDKAVEKADHVRDDASAILDKAVAIKDRLKSDGGLDLDFTDLDDALARVRANADEVRSEIDQIHGDATRDRNQVDGNGGMSDLNAALKAQICALKNVDVATKENLLSYISTTSCDDDLDPATGEPKTLNGPPGPVGGDSMGERLSTDATNWQALIDATDTSDTSQSTLKVTLDKLDTNLSSSDSGDDVISVAEAVQALKDASSSNDSELRKEFRELSQLIGTDDTTDCDAWLDWGKGVLSKDVCDLKEEVGDIKDDVSGKIDDAEEKFTGTITDAKTKSKEALQDQIRQAGEQKKLSHAQLEAMFDASTHGLNSAADAITANGKKTIGKQRKQFAAQQEAAARHIGTSIEKGLGEIAKGVSSSTRDMKAANTLLARDLRKVLLDLGQRKVHGSGLLGSMATSAATAGSADYQLALATRKSSSYANVRSGDIAGLMLRQAQADAAMQRLAQLPPFALELDPGTQHQTVYTFHLGSAK